MNEDGDVVGQRLVEASRWCAIRGLSLRAVRVDGVMQVVTRDLNPSRLNVELERGVVVRFVGRG